MATNSKSKKLSAALIDRGFRLLSYIGKDPVLVRLILLEPVDDFLARCHDGSILHLSRSGNRVELGFSHDDVDVLAALSILRNRYVEDSQLPVPDVITIDIPCPTRRSSRRLVRRSFGRRVRWFQNPEDTYRTLYLNVDGLPSSSVTEELTVAIHRLSFMMDDRASFSSVLVPITAKQWSADRAITNYSAGFLSVLSSSEVSKAVSIVSKQFHAARRRRYYLLRRVATWGRLPSLFWPIIRLLQLTSPSETTILSNPGKILDSQLSRIADAIYFVPPVRSRATLGVGLLTIGSSTTLTLSGFANRRDLTRIAKALAELSNLRLDPACE